MTQQLADLIRLNKELVRPAVYAGVGFVNTAVDMATFAILTETGVLSALPANVISFCLGAINSFVLNSLITFRDRHEDRWGIQRIVRFAALTAASLGLSSASLAAALWVFSPLVAKGISVIIVFAITYAFSTAFVFSAQQRSPRR